MSNSELENWNPMEDEYRKHASDDFDPLCLIIRDIPLQNKKDFKELPPLRKCITFRLNNKHQPHHITTYGFASFETYEDALEALNQLKRMEGLSVAFAAKKNKNNYMEKMRATSVGRGARIDLDGVKSLNKSHSSLFQKKTGLQESRMTPSPRQPSSHIKIMKDSESRRVIVESPNTDTDCTPGLVSNPFFFCFCGRESKLACRCCKKPYCCKNCQIYDWPEHQKICENSKGVTDSLLRFFQIFRDNSDNHSTSNSHSESSDKENIAKTNNGTHRAKRSESLNENKEIEFLTLSDGEVEMVSVSHIINPGKFCIQLKKYSEELKKMEQELCLKDKFHNDLNPDQQKIFCGLSYNNKMYRGKVLKPDLLVTKLSQSRRKYESNPNVIDAEVVSEGEILVRLIDYGNNVTVPKDSLYRLPVEFRNLPIQALSCKLVDKTLKRDVKWNEEDTDSFQLLTSGKSLKAHIIRGTKGGVYDVSLTNEEGMALYTVLVNVKDEGSPNVKPTTPNQHSAAVKNVSPVSTNVPVQKSSPDRLKWNQKMLSSKILLQSESMKYNVKIAFIKTVYELYVNFVEDEAKMAEMISSLNDFCNSRNASYVPVVGEIVCCKYSDGVWYRGQVKEKCSGKYLVYFIDYGNEYRVEGKDIQVLPDKFVSAKFSVCVSLAGIKNEDLSEKHVSKLLKEIWNMKVVDNTKNPIEVMLYLKDCSLMEMIASDRMGRNNLKFKKLPTNVDVNVKVCYEDKKYVYLQQVEDSKTIEEVLHKLNSPLDLPPAKNPALNNVYSGLFTDALWYRVSIEEIVSPDTFKVYFLDFGNYENLSVDKLRELPKDLFAAPVCCIPVTVENRKEVTLKIDEEYSAKVTGMQGEHQKVKFLVQTVESRSPDISSFKKRHLENNLSKVTFFSNENGITYCQLSSDCDLVLELFKKLQQCGRQGTTPASVSVGDVVCAQSCDNLWYRASVISVRNAPSYQVLFIDYGNSEYVTRDCIKVLPTDALEVPVFAIPLKIQNADKLTEYSITKPLLVKKIKVLDDGVHLVEIQTEDESLPKLSALKIETLPSDSVSLVTVTHCENDVYYVQPASLEGKVAELSNELLKAETFKDMPCAPSVNDVVCAKYSDSCWYRCVVKKVSDDKIAGVFIDYGNLETISLKNVKLLPSQLCSYPILCIPIKFSNKESLVEKLEQSVITFHVTVSKLDGDIQVVDILSENYVTPSSSRSQSVVASYTPVFSSSLKKSPLTMNSTCELIFKACVDNLYFAIKGDNFQEMQQLSSLLQETKTNEISHLPSTHEILLAKRKDNVKYRCCVEKAVSETDTYKVNFVDLGIVENVHKNELYCLPESCISFPFFSVKILVETEEPIILNKCYKVQVFKQNADIYTVRVFHQHMFSSISHKQLPISAEKQIIFSYKESDQLFLQSVDDMKMIHEVQNLLHELSPSSSIPYKPSVDELVCARSQLYNSWYRGCILNVLEADEYKIFFIDYGNCEKLSVEHLQPMPPSLIKFPSFAIPVKFANAGTSDLVELERMYIVVAETKPPVQIIKLIDEDLENDQIAVGEKQASDKEHASLEESVNNCTKLQKFAFTSCKSVPFHPGTQNIVIYSALPERYVFCAPYDANNIAANIDLTKIITEHVNKSGIPFDSNCEPEQGEMVLALFTEDEQWYRATIIEKSPPDLYVVNFVDYGNTETLDISCLRKMEEQFLELDIQAHMCSLSGFAVSNENSSKVYEELKTFTIFVNPEPLEAHVEIDDDEITVSVPKITSSLVEKSLVTIM